MSNDRSRNDDDRSPPKIDSIFLGIYHLEKGSSAKGKPWYRYRAHWVVDLPSKERPGDTYTSTVAVEGFLNDEVWRKLEPFHETLLEDRKDRKTRVMIRAVNSFLKPPSAYSVDRQSSGTKPVPVLSFSVYRVSHAKRPGEEWIVYPDEQDKAAIRRRISEAIYASSDQTVPVNGSGASNTGVKPKVTDSFGML